MRTRTQDWANLKTMKQEYGLQVFLDGKWRSVASNGKPCIFKTAEERDALRAELRSKKGAEHGE